ncbi:CehA/McbA family metallohydrolase domain-containing protein [Singulisphaera rosea]
MNGVRRKARRWGLVGLLFVATWVGARSSSAQGLVPVDLSGYKPECGAGVESVDGHLNVTWPVGGGDVGRLVLDLRPKSPLVERLALGSRADEPRKGESVLLAGVDPVTFVTVGSRESPPDRPPGMSVFNVFFDTPARRTSSRFRSQLEVKGVKVVSRGRRVTVVVDGLTVGPFAGTLEFTTYAGSPLLHVESVVSTKEERRAYLYDAGLVAATPTWQRVVWKDTEGRLQRLDAARSSGDRGIHVRHRTLVAESAGGSVACFPPPHQYFFPRDVTDNLGTVWAGRDHRGMETRPGFGIRQAETGGGAYVPWFNAPRGSFQRLGVFYLLSRGKAEDALRETLRYTHNDRFPELPGHLTLTSHWHMAIAVAAMQEQARGTVRTRPDFVDMFKEMGVKAVHIADFHGDGHPQDPGPLRLPELDALFDECRRLSDAEFLLLPGEEANVYLGTEGPNRHPGHWLYLFPKPVYWTMRRAPSEPFATRDPKRGTIHHVGSQEDMVRLLRQENGLAWTAHPRIKASNWAPDDYRHEAFYRDDHWLGAAWKAMPADLSRSRLGERSLDLLDDMANWGSHKSVLGEVDVFKIDHTHELYGHMNVNYVRLDRLPRFDDDWQPILDAIRGGRFFVTTGEVLLRDFRAGGKSSGETLPVGADSKVELTLEPDWTFPLKSVRWISGDGERTYHDEVDLAETEAFGRKTVATSLDLRGRRWVRAEAWDIAGNGAFTQPVWLSSTNDTPKP